jgi:isopentenyl-diphosphate delta-isomerase
MEERKKDHIDLALNSQTLKDTLDDRFNYEPMFKPHPSGSPQPFEFLGKRQKVPLWVSSMTGGTKMAGIINRNLARACHEFGMGMGLGSCRIIMDDDTYFEDFNVRPIIGNEYPLYANLGIAQIEEFIESNSMDRILSLLDRLQADGLVVHINPLQEWCQPEGDHFKYAPIDTMQRLLDQTDLRIIVKEVGQGMGPESLRALLKLPLEAIEFAAFGGTNFALVELARSAPAMKAFYEPITAVGHTAVEMLDMVNHIFDTEQEILCRQVIISGGIKTFLDGYYLVKKSRLPAIYGQASGFLMHARENYETLREYVGYQVKGWQLAEAYLSPKFD